MTSASPPLGVSAQESSAPDLALSRAAARSAQAVSNAASFSNHTLRCVVGSPANQNSRTSMALVMAFWCGVGARRRGLCRLHVLGEHAAFGPVRSRGEDASRRGRFRSAGRRFVSYLYAVLAMYRSSGAIPRHRIRLRAQAFRDTERGGP